MIKAQDAIREARSHIETPYAQMDCINLIKAIIRRSPGGVPGYTTAGSNALWKSYDMSAKYKDLTWRQKGLSGAQPGMLVFKADGDDYHHVGIVTERGTVVHASSVHSATVETALTERDGWTHLAIHRHIDTEEVERMEANKTLFRAIVMTAEGALNMRADSMRRAPVIGKIPKGAIIDVYETGEDMWRVAYDGKVGWAVSEYLSRHTDDTDPVDDAPHTALIRDDGMMILLAGRWRVAED